MTTEPKPFALPPMPEPWAPQETSCFDDRKKWIDHSFQLAEIAQAQARRAERILEHAKAAHPHSAVLLVRLTQAEAERDALKARVAERGDSIYITDGHGTLYGTPEVIGWITDELDRLESALAQRDREVLALREALGKIVAHSVKFEPWGSIYYHIANDTLASTAQAGEEAERRVLEAAWGRVCFHPRDTGEAANLEHQGIKAAILGTEPNP